MVGGIRAVWAHIKWKATIDRFGNTLQNVLNLLKPVLPIWLLAMTRRAEAALDIVPIAVSEMLDDSDKEKSEMMMKSLLQMKKLDIKTLEEAYDSV
jgi:hypothetical protein